MPLFEARLAPLEPKRHSGPEPHTARAGDQAAPSWRCAAREPGVGRAETAIAAGGNRRAGVSGHARHAVGTPRAGTFALGYEAGIAALRVAPAADAARAPLRSVDPPHQQSARRL